MATVFITGQKAFGAAAAQRVMELGHEIVGVCSPAFADPHGHLRAHEEIEGVRRDRLRVFASLKNLPWVESVALRAEHVPDGTDVILAAHSHAFVGRKTRSRAKVAIGYHPSLLPLHRGRDAIRWALYMGERVVGGSVYHLTDRVDAGPIAAQDYVILPPGLDAGQAWRDYLFPLGLDLIEMVLAEVDKGRVHFIPQDEKLATWEPSWERPPLFRPELPELPGPNGWNSDIEFIGERARV